MILLWGFNLTLYKDTKPWEARKAFLELMQ